MNIGQLYCGDKPTNKMQATIKPAKCGLQVLEGYPTSIEADQEILIQNGIFPKDVDADDGRSFKLSNVSLQKPKLPMLQCLQLGAVSARWSEKRALTSALYVVDHKRRKLFDDGRGRKTIIK